MNGVRENGTICWISGESAINISLIDLDYRQKHVSYPSTRKQTTTLFGAYEKLPGNSHLFSGHIDPASC